MSSPIASTPPEPASPAFTPWHKRLLICWLALLALTVIWHLREPVPPLHPALSALLGSLPLWLPAIGVLRARRQSVIVLATLVLLPFCHAIANLQALLAGQAPLSAGRQGELLWPLAELLLSVLVFVCALLTARWLGRGGARNVATDAGKAAPKTDGSETG